MIMEQKDFYKQLADQFDDNLPKGHLERFENRLTSLHRGIIKKKLLIYSTVAASVAIALTLSVIFTYKENSPVQTAAYSEFLETQTYFKMEINTKMKQLSRYPLVAKMVKKDMQDIDKSVKNVQNDLQKNPDDERVINAAILTYQTKLELLDRVLSQTKTNNKL